MKFQIALFIVAATMLATATIAGEKAHKKFEVIIDDGSTGSATHLSLDSDEMGFELHDLQEGETRSIVNESGQSILITREADGYKINVDGKTIELPDFDGPHEAMWLGDGDSTDVNVHVIHDARFVTQGSSEGVTIISAEPIDDVTRESIKSLLLSSGHSDEVNFIDGGDSKGGMHKIKIVRKETEKTL